MRLRTTRCSTAAQLKPGETLLVLGAGGGVGLAAVELGKIAGARVIAIASSDEKLDAARAHGADAAINYGAGDLREQLKEATGGKGVDVVYDPVGGRHTEAALRIAGVARAPAGGRLRGRRDPADPGEPAADQGCVGGRRVLGRVRHARAAGEPDDADRTLRLARRGQAAAARVAPLPAGGRAAARSRRLLARRAVGKLGASSRGLDIR